MSYDISEWGLQSFAFKQDAPSDVADRTAVAVHDGPLGPTAVIPDAHLLFTAQFERAGLDLILRGDHGQVVVVHDYFASDHHPQLLSPDGAALSPEVVAALAGPLAPGEYAQATATPSNAEAVGRVVKVDGDATIIRNGVAVTLHVGDAILKGDVLRTGGGTLGVTFNDGSTLNLTAHARLVVNEFVYDAHSSNNSEILNLVQGSLTFISGHVAHQGHMKINTPVATLGIRGTVGGVTEANDGTVSFYVAESATGAVLTDSQGHVLAQVLQNGPQIVVRPVGPLNVLAEELQKTPAELAKELSVVQQLVSLQSVGQQIIQQFFQPNPNNGNNPNPQSTDHPHTQIQIQFPTQSTASSDSGGGTGSSGGPGDQVTATVRVTTTDDTTHTTTDLLPPEVVTVTIPPAVTTPNAPVVQANAASVSEEGLVHGIADTTGSVDSTDSATATGTISATAAGHSQLTFTLANPSTSLTSGGVAVTWEGAGTGTLIGKAGGNTVITVAIDEHSGSYTVTLAAPIDHRGGGEDVKSFDVPVQVSDGSASTLSTLTVNVEDDSPAAPAISTSAATSGSQTTVNLVLILDISGSMGDIVSGSETRLALAQSALHNLLTTSDVTINQVMAVAFGTTATFYHDTLGSVWTDATTADTFIADLSANGGSTRYDAALSTVESKWGAGPTQADQTLVYFISDGQPDSGHGANASTWEAFLANPTGSQTPHSVNVSYAIGISTSATDADLTPIAWTPSDANSSPITLTDASGLDTTLQSTVPAATHNIFDDGAGFGADGGHILSVAVDGVTYTWDGTNTITESADHGATLSSTSFDVATDLGGHFTFYFADGGGHSAGDWTYQGPTSAPQATSDEVFHYVLTDNEGDHAGADITLTVTGADAPPKISADGLVTSHFGQGSTAVTGLAFSDTDAGNNSLTYTMTADHGALAFAQTEASLSETSNGSNGTLSGSGSLADINQAFADGVVHTPAATMTDTNKVVLTINDNQGGSDSLTFVFSEADPPSTTPVHLEGTSGKDMIFANGYANTLTGNGGSDSFVFRSVSDSGPGTNHDTIADFTHGSDHLDLSAISGATQVQGQVSDSGTVEAHGISWYVDNTNGETVVSVNTSATANHVDMEIHLTGTNINLAASDILHHA